MNAEQGPTSVRPTSVRPTSVVTDWVDCVALVTASPEHAGPTRAGVLSARAKLLGNPVLGALARVVDQADVDPFTTGPDQVAAVLHGRLLHAALAADADAAPRVTFCVAVVHPDQGEADELVKALAATDAMSRLPVRFPVVTFDPGAADGGSAVVADGIIRAVDATAHQVTREPRFSLTRGQLRKLAEPTGADGRSSPSTEVVVRAETAVDPLPAPWTTATADGSAAEAEPARGRHTAPDDGRAGIGLRDVAAAIRSRLPRRTVPASNVEVIEQLSARTGTVPMLYVVAVSEPVRPRRALRHRRATVALDLITTLGAATGNEAWYIRAFTADRRLHPAPPLPPADQVRRRHLPERWGSYFELHDCVDDILDRIEQDSSSFVRRGGHRPRAVVVLLANKRLSVSSDLDRSLARLAAAATTVVVLFEQSPAAASEDRDRRLHLLTDHEDVVDQLTRLLLDDAGTDRR